jgi:hypothetical protein
MSVVAYRIAGAVLLVITLAAAGDDYRLREEVHALRDDVHAMREQMAQEQVQRQANIDAAARALIKLNGGTKTTKIEGSL